MFKRTTFLEVHCRLDEFFPNEEKALDRNNKSEIHHVHIDEQREVRARRILEVQPAKDDVEPLKEVKSTESEVADSEQSANDK